MHILTPFMLLIHTGALEAQMVDTIQTADASIVERVESSVIIRAETHEELWNVPRLVVDPEAPDTGWLVVNVADRHGKDRSFGRHYFLTRDGFASIEEVPEKPAAFGRFDARLVTGRDGFPESPGHQGTAPYIRLDEDRVVKAFTFKKDDVQNWVTSAICRLTDAGLEPLELGNAHTIPESRRGLYEPHLVTWRGRYYMTGRSEDRRGYLLVSDDGLNWSEPRPWTWDDGTPVAMDQTMTKLLSHPQGLVLVYTRIREDNTETFRHRAPLHIADLDETSLRLERDTERIIVPDRGLAVGNFWVWDRTEHETLVTTAEWPRDGRTTNGDIWLARIRWRTPNTPTR